MKTATPLLGSKASSNLHALDCILLTVDRVVHDSSKAHLTNIFFKPRVVGACSCNPTQVEN